MRDLAVNGYCAGNPGIGRVPSMHFQRDAFLQSEGDAWFDRNAARLDGSDDPVLKAIEQLQIAASDALEIGCSNGWRLDKLSQRGVACSGVDPSEKAVLTGSERINLKVGTADHLPFADRSFDLVIFGFCLYLIDPALHFRCVAEADRVLAESGFLIIYDFMTPRPYYNDYVHLSGVHAHKMQFSNYFLANPAYSLVHREIGAVADVDGRIGVDVETISFGGGAPGLENPPIFAPM